MRVRLRPGSIPVPGPDRRQTHAIAVAARDAVPLVGAAAISVIALAAARALLI